MFYPKFSLHPLVIKNYCGVAAQSFDVLTNGIKTISLTVDGQNLFPAHQRIIFGHGRDYSLPEVTNRNQLILFGFSADPLLPFKGKFDCALRLLEKLLLSSASWLHIQTRSPLIILALPILKPFKNKISLHVPIDIDCDKESKRLFKNDPLPSERRHAANVFLKQGFAVDTAPKLAALKQ